MINLKRNEIVYNTFLVSFTRSIVLESYSELFLIRAGGPVTITVTCDDLISNNRKLFCNDSNYVTTVIFTGGVNVGKVNNPTFTIQPNDSIELLGIGANQYFVIKNRNNILLSANDAVSPTKSDLNVRYPFNFINDIGTVLTLTALNKNIVRISPTDWQEVSMVL